MDPNTELIFSYRDLFHVYKNGRIERFAGTDTVPASNDPVTGVASKDAAIDPDKNISARLYLPKLADSSIKKLPILIYFHGGAFCLQSAFSPIYRPFLNPLVSQARVLAVSVDYRLATEHLLPTAYDDSWDAVKWVFSSQSDEWIAEFGDFERVFVAGDSAGGNIAHHMAMRAGQNGLKIEGMALIQPFFWGSEAIRSETTDITKREYIEKLWSVVNSPGVDIHHPWINPIAKEAPSLKGLGCKRAMVCVAENDVLVERGRVYVEALKESGWIGDQVELVESQGEDHIFHLKKPGCEKALELVNKLVGFFNNESNDEIHL